MLCFARDAPPFCMISVAELSGDDSRGDHQASTRALGQCARRSSDASDLVAGWTMMFPLQHISAETVDKAKSRSGYWANEPCGQVPVLAFLFSRPSYVYSSTPDKALRWLVTLDRLTARTLGCGSVRRCRERDGSRIGPLPLSALRKRAGEARNKEVLASWGPCSATPSAL